MLSEHERYAHTRREFGPVARRQLVFGLHVHVAVGGADRALAVHNALRSYLPELAALGANAPFYEGRASGLDSVRPKLSELLPRQGVPPPIGSLDELAAAYRWGVRAGVARVPGAVVVGAAAASRARHRRGPRARHAGHDRPTRQPSARSSMRSSPAWPTATTPAICGAPAAGWRIEENRWSACRHGTRGTMADLETGAPAPTADRLHALLDELEPAAARLGCARRAGRRPAR